MGKFSYLPLLICTLLAGNATAQLSIEELRCENKPAPVGVDQHQVRFSWVLSSPENGQYQTAYQLIIASSPRQALSRSGDIYQSGKQSGAQSIQVPYLGGNLQGGRTYYWTLRVWDKKDRVSHWSSIHHFTTALESPEGWHGASWIGKEQLPDSMRVAPGIHAPFADGLGNKCLQAPVVPLFRKSFRLVKQVQSALLFVSGIGQYNFSVNGKKIGKAFLTPGWTYFDKTVLYNTYDVTDRLRMGTNAMGAMVGSGFYNINRERYFKIVSAFGMPSIICRLAIHYTDGSEDNIVTDTSWKVTSSPVTFSSIYGGEDYDARLEQGNWDGASFDDKGWKHALVVKGPRGKLVAEQDYPVAIMDSFRVKTVVESDPGIFLYDFGQNASGIVRIRVRGKKGQTIKLFPAELIDKNRRVNQAESGDPYYLTYTLKGDQEEIWQPAFTYYGFRYVQVEGAVPAGRKPVADKPVILELTELHTRNSSPAVGTFVCSNELFNRIYRLINWAIKSNIQSVVTDCPHREKLSWLEQDYLMGASIHYNFDIYSLYRKLVLDLIDAQYEQGFIPDIAPEYVVFQDGFLDSPEWGSASVILPWLLYEWYGDKDIVAKAYTMMKKYVTYLESKSEGHILSHGLGDWYDYGPNPPGEAQLTPKAVTASAIYYYDVVLLARMSAILGQEQDVSFYQDLAASIRQAFNHRFFDPVSKVYATGSQTSMAMPLCVGLVEDSCRKNVLANLMDSINRSNKALTAGDIGFHFLVRALDEGGASQLIFDMNNRDDVPGYGFQLKKHATALTESWPALDNVSNNHLMLGHIMEWFYSGLSGIGQMDSSVAFHHIRIRPQPVGDIRFAKGSFHSPYGWIRSTWQKAPGIFRLKATIPVNTNATVFLPATSTSRLYLNGKLMTPLKIREGYAELDIPAGNYLFEVKDKQ